MFELPPFRKCPGCKSESFGTLSVGGNRVTKRCKECRYSHDEVLPNVDKRVIYLDQFAVSELYKTKTVNRRWNGTPYRHPKGTGHARYRRSLIWLPRPRVGPRFSGLSRSDLVHWHFSDMARCLS
jgi:hypothetical protein